jgi:hypothetical protein
MFSSFFPVSLMKFCSFDIFLPFEVFLFDLSHSTFCPSMLFTVGVFYFDVLPVNPISELRLA